MHIVPDIVGRTGNALLRKHTVECFCRGNTYFLNYKELE